MKLNPFKNLLRIFVYKAMGFTAFSIKKSSYWLETIQMKAYLKSLHLNNVGKIFSYTTPEELRTLFILARSCPANSTALEIGSHLGASACYIGAGLNWIDGKLLCVDTWQNDTVPEGARDTFDEFKKNTSAINNLITPIRKRSENLTSTDILTMLHLVFIDGDHSYAAAKKDLEIITPWVVDGGIVALHDSIFFEGVSKTLGEALASGDWQLAGNIQNLTWLRKVSKNRTEFAFKIEQPKIVEISNSAR